MELIKLEDYNNIYEVQGFELEFKNLLKKSGEYQACKKKLKFNLSFLDNSGGVQKALLHKNIEKLSDEKNLYSIRNISSLNPRTIFCCAVDDNTYILLTSFLEKSTSDYEKAIVLAKNIKKALDID